MLGVDEVIGDRGMTEVVEVVRATQVRILGGVPRPLLLAHPRQATVITVPDGHDDVGRRRS